MCFTQIDVWARAAYVCSETSRGALWDTAARIREAYGTVNHPDTTGVVAVGTVCTHELCV